MFLFFLKEIIASRSVVEIFDLFFRGLAFIYLFIYLFIYIYSDIYTIRGRAYQIWELNFTLCTSWPSIRLCLMAAAL